MDGIIDATGINEGWSLLHIYVEYKGIPMHQLTQGCLQAVSIWHAPVKLA